jgi:hypothetical protein
MDADLEADGWLGSFVVLVRGLVGPLKVVISQSHLGLVRQMRHGMLGAPQIIAAFPGGTHVEEWVLTKLLPWRIADLPGWFETNSTTLAFAKSLRDGAPSWLKWLGDESGPVAAFGDYRESAADVFNEIKNEYGYETSFRSHHHKEPFTRGELRPEVVAGFLRGFEYACPPSVVAELVDEFRPGGSIRVGPFELLEVANPPHGRGL